MGLMTFSGTVKSGGVFDVKGRDGSVKQLISFTSIDAVGNALSCQMWPDDPQHGQLMSVIPSARRQHVELEVAGYAVRMREFKSGNKEPQFNCVVTNVTFPGQATMPSGMYCAGTVKTANAFDVKTKNGPAKLISFTVVDDLGNSWPCQMWPDDPQHEQLLSVIPAARRQPVQFEVAYYSLRMRTFTDGSPSKPQVNFVVSRVSLPGLGLQAA